MIESDIQGLLFDSLCALSLLLMGSVLFLFPSRTVNILHELCAVFPSISARNGLEIGCYRGYGLILIGFSSYEIFRVYVA